MKPPEFSKTAAWLVSLLLTCHALAAGAAGAGIEPIRLHPENPHYFLWRGEAKRAPTVAAHCLSQPARAYAIYVHGGVQAELTLALPPGQYRAAWLSTKTGRVETRASFRHDKGTQTLVSRPYVDDIALRLVRRVENRE